jgi:hypothetical protein
MLQTDNKAQILQTETFALELKPISLDSFELIYTDIKSKEIYIILVNQSTLNDTMQGFIGPDVRFLFEKVEKDFKK